MARKKKQAEETIQEQIIEEPIAIDTSEAEEQITKSSTTSSISYQGNVKVTIKKGNKVISSKIYHNNGGNPLFQFLCNCIAGSYQENDRPKFVRLFYNTSPWTTETDTKIDVYNSDPCSSYIAVNKIGFADADKTSIVLHFIIPCAFITSNQINQVGVYSSSNATDQLDNYSAYYNFTKQTESGEDWDPIEISTVNGDYNLFLEWTMSFGNNN